MDLHTRWVHRRKKFIDGKTECLRRNHREQRHEYMCVIVFKCCLLFALLTQYEGCCLAVNTSIADIPRSFSKMNVSQSNSNKYEYENHSYLIHIFLCGIHCRLWHEKRFGILLLENIYGKMRIRIRYINIYM